MDEPPRFRQSSHKFARAQRQKITDRNYVLAGRRPIIELTGFIFADGADHFAEADRRVDEARVAQVLAPRVFCGKLPPVRLR
jgi:hypothetical protein